MTTINDSSTGGYLQPSPQFPTLPGPLTLNQFLQSVLVGISGLPGDMVRPKFQVEPPKQPDIFTNWLAFAPVDNAPDANAFVGSVLDGPDTVNITQRMSKLEVQCGFYGPASLEYADLTRDGFQIPQNLASLTQAGMGFVGSNNAKRVPDLVNERWVDRWEISFFINRQVLRAYPILPFLSVAGRIETITNGSNLKIVNWKTNV